MSPQPKLVIQPSPFVIPVTAGSAGSVMGVSKTVYAPPTVKSPTVHFGNQDKIAVSR